MNTKIKENGNKKVLNSKFQNYSNAEQNTICKIKSKINYGY